MSTQYKKPLLNQYKGELSPEDTLAGIEAAKRNAKRLATDARFLLENKSYPSAASLAALSIEESGKISILRGIVASPTKWLKVGWKQYRDHRSKNGMWIIPDLIKKGARSASELISSVDRDGEHTATLDSVKQIGFYTDCYGNKNWSEPEKVIDKSLATSLVTTAELLIEQKEIKLRELELYKQVMKPVYATPQMALALLEYHRLLRSEGFEASSEVEIKRYIQAVLKKNKISK